MGDKKETDVNYKFGKQIPCDSHCYKEWYKYDAVMGHLRTEELDTLFGADLLAYCPCNKISCSFVYEVYPLIPDADYTFVR